MASSRARQHAPWSASKVQTALRCPREFHYRYVEKVAEIETMLEAKVGKAIHAALEAVLLGTPPPEAVAAARGALLAEGELVRYDGLARQVAPFLARVEAFRRRRRIARQLIEFFLAVREDFTATQFYSGDAFYRGVFDAGYLYNDDQLALIDHKTGIRRPSLSITEQLEGYAVLAAAQFRYVRRFWLGVHWVADADLEWRAPVSQADVNQRFVPSVMANIEAAALAVDDGPRPNPSPWCAGCGYRTICPAAMEELFEPVDDEPDLDL